MSDDFEKRFSPENRFFRPRPIRPGRDKGLCQAIQEQIRQGRDHRYIQVHLKNCPYCRAKQAKHVN